LRLPLADIQGRKRQAAIEERRGNADHDRQQQTNTTCNTCGTLQSWQLTQSRIVGCLG
jgi:hypothetical protein